ncbi:hypothetical protein EOJ36_11510 [Sandaracinomonas limnophila]|uniref:CarboxypepD_reg-like domain-containing protein n=1 Tax=Sandaracinomonas limnophila TaxID=1862386 RepID=A0A437PM20_9BACT|nr:carboxypeptidase-like regulatory domain-containing protein [Sandaracinomonas limnophila]RVU23351.1 hypothetical protein EOJ36_11510 [Sandaracinomonas limnophila]
MKVIRIRFSFLSILGVLLFSIPNGLLGQDQLINILDAETNKPISYANLYFKKQNSVFTVNENGTFIISSKRKEINDTINISCVGYQTKQVIINKIANFDTIKLIPNIIELPEIQVNSTNTKTFRTEKTKAKGSIGGIPNNQFMIGLSFDSTQFAFKKIEAVMVYIHRGGDSNTPFRIRFFKLQNDMPVDEEFYQINMVVHAAKTGWNTFSISGNQPQIPSSGCFIAVEWLDFQTIDISKIDYTKKNFNLDFNKYRGQYIGMGFYSYKQNKSKGYYKTINSKNGQWFSSNSLFNNYKQPEFKNQILKPMIALSLTN